MPLFAAEDDTPLFLPVEDYGLAVCVPDAKTRCNFLN